MDSNEALIQELTELRAELDLERSRRIAAEALATERLTTLSAAQQMVADLSQQLAERFRSLDSFATKLLERATPEKPPSAPYRMERLPEPRKVSARNGDLNPGEFYKRLKTAYGKNLKPDASKYPAVAAAIEKMAEEQIQ